jgi:8-oxo-dGTP diphosphatase
MSEDHPQYRAWQQSLPKQSLTSKVILQTEDGAWVVVKSPHRSHWQLPGGGVDLHETPRAAAKREVAEELGLAISEPQLLLVDSVVTRGEHGDGLLFYWRAFVENSDLEAVVLQKGEIEDYRVIRRREALELLGDTVARRLQTYYALSVEQQSAVVYMEEGAVPGTDDEDFEL